MMATTMESSMNISALKLVDPSVKSIVDTAAHVALYTFHGESYEWEKMNVEGALFVCCRSGEPKYNIIILNRLNTFNLNEPIVDGIDLQLKDPFLLYRNVQGHINGIWFYEKEECIRIASSLNGLVKANFTSSEGLVKKPPDPNIKKKEEEKITSKRVMDFFAKASNNAPSQATLGFKPPPPGIKKEESHPLIQRLMSNPVKTLEQIEKQQRAITPQKEKKRPASLQVNSRPNKLENGFACMSISDTSPTHFRTQHFFNSTLAAAGVAPHTQPLEVSELETSVTSSSAAPDTPSKPELITPDMFAQSTIKKDDLSLNIRPEPLTKSQLLQAVSYLLKNDSDFINKLHEAYLKSFVDIVS